MSKDQTPPAKQRAISHSESYRGKFQAVFQELLKELTEDGLKNPEIADGIRHLQEVSESTYVCPELTSRVLRSPESKNEEMRKGKGIGLLTTSPES